MTQCRALVNVQESSAARLGEDGDGPWLWVFCHATEAANDEAPHLSLAEATRLRDALSAWITDTMRLVNDEP